MKKYGFIGLGSQGAPMARRMIEAGLPTVLWARRPDSLQPFADTAAERADSLEALAAEVDYVALCVVSNDDVVEVCGRLMPHMRPGSHVVIHSTIHPDVCISLAAEACRRGLRLVDAPVSGGAPAAEQGTLTVMLGAEEDDVAAVRPVLATFATMITHLGAVGAGQRAKLINNTMLTANIAIAHYGLEAAAHLGLERDAFIDLVRASSGHSRGFDVSARMSEPAAFAHGAAMLQKDVGLLGEALGQQPAFKVLSEAAQSFLKLVPPRS